QAFVLALLEDRSVLELGTQVQADETHRSGDEERQPPSPVVHGLRAEAHQQAERDQRSERVTAERAELEEASVEPASTVGGVLRHERRGATVLAAGGEALQDA